MRSTFTRTVNAIRVRNVPFLNFFIVAVLGLFLVRLTTKYTDLYMRNSLITIIVTNLVLYGISETLAQLILAYDPGLAWVLVSVSSGLRLAWGRYRYRDDPGALTPDLGAASDLGEHREPRAHPDLEAARESSELPESDDDTSDLDEEVLHSMLSAWGYSDSNLPAQVAPVLAAPRQPPRKAYFLFNRLAGFMCWGFVMAFVQCWWYRFLQIYSKHPQFVEVIRKVMLDQFCFSPISLFCFFTYGTMVLESGTWEDTKAKLRRLYLPTLVANYCVWFPVQFVNFLLVPRDYQVPFLSSVLVLWNCFLSMRNQL